VLICSCRSDELVLCTPWGGLACGKITEIAILTGPARLRQFDPAVLGDWPSATVLPVPHR